MYRRRWLAGVALGGIAANVALAGAALLAVRILAAL
jgi:hypothetical protein